MPSLANIRTFKTKIIKYWPVSLILAGVLFLTSCANHSDLNKAKSTFYVIQPAEHYAGFDGHLSWYGRRRAGDLMRFLKDSGIRRIYVTPFSRSVETVDSLIAAHSIDTVEYIIDSSGNSILKLLKQRSDFGRKVLIVARPVVLPNLIRKLGAPFEKDSVAGDHFNRMYVIVNHKGKASLKEQTFGGAPLPADTSGGEKDLE